MLGQEHAGRGWVDPRLYVRRALVLPAGELMKDLQHRIQGGLGVAFEPAQGREPQPTEVALQATDVLRSAR